MSDVLYLAWRYLLYHKVKTFVLVAAVTITAYLPIGLEVLVRQSAEEMTARARSTPLLVGKKGSPLELVLNALYFESAPPQEMIPFQEVSRAQEKGYATAIPLHTHFRTSRSPIVGTTLEYFEMRGLTLAEGRHFGMLGECVLGAKSAQKEEVKIGDFVLSAQISAFSFGNYYPLKMKVVGILKPTGTADDVAVFVDVKTPWVIVGDIHGHETVEKKDDPRVLEVKEGRTILNASIIQYNEITEENVGSFHFHGDPDAGDEKHFLITAVLANPKDERSATLLRGNYVTGDVQMVKPATVMDDLLKTIFTVRSYVLIAVTLLGTATLATMILVFTLSLQQRRREIETMNRIGGSRIRIAGVLTLEIVGVLVLAALLTGALTLLTTWFAPAITRAVLVSS